MIVRVLLHDAAPLQAVIRQFKQFLDDYGCKQNYFHFNISMKSYIMNIS